MSNALKRALKSHSIAFALGFLAAMLTAALNGLNARPTKAQAPR